MGLFGDGAGRGCWLGMARRLAGECLVLVRSPLACHRRVLDLLGSTAELLSGVAVVDVAARFCWCARYDTLVGRA